MTASDETSVTNSLQTKLQTKLLVSPSVINTQQLHRHYSGHYAMANRLLQRLALPEQITSRYNAGILSTEATRSPAQRFQRKESFAEIRPLVNATVVQRATNAPTNPQWEQNDESINSSTQHQELTVSVPPKQPYTAPAINSPEISVLQRLSGQDSIPASSESPSATYRISRRASNLDAFADANISNNSVSESPNNSANNLALSSISLPVTSSPEIPSSTYRISPRPASFDNENEGNASLLPLVPLDAIANTRNTTLGDSSNQTLTGQIQTKIQPQVDPQIQLRENTASSSYPLFRETVPDSIISKKTVDVANPDSKANDLAIQRKYHQSELLMRSRQDTTGLSIKGARNFASPTTNPAKSFNENANGNANVIRMVANPMDTIVQTKSLPLFSQSQVAVPPDGGDGLTNRPDLPLAISPSHNTVVNRQTTSAELATSETINPLPPPTSNVSPSNTSVDVTEIAEKVSRIILRRLQVERERRGVSR